MDQGRASRYSEDITFAESGIVGLGDDHTVLSIFLYAWNFA